MITVTWAPHESDRLPKNETSWLAYANDRMIGCIRGNRRVWRGCVAGDVAWRVLVRGKSASAPAAMAGFVTWFNGHPEAKALGDRLSKIERRTAAWGRLADRLLLARRSA